MITDLTDLVQAIEIDSQNFSATIGFGSGIRISGSDQRDLESELARAIYQNFHVRCANFSEQIERDIAYDNKIDDMVPSVRVDVPLRNVGSFRGVETTSLFGARVRTTKQDRSQSKICVPSNLRAISPGFYLVSGCESVQSGFDKIVRIYAAISNPDSAPEIFGRVVRELRKSVRKWQAKLASTPRMYPRTDALTIYLTAEDRQTCIRLAEILEESGGVSDPTSIFTGRVKAGIAIAEDPRPTMPGLRGLSFGQHRATVLARGFAQRRIHDINDLDAYLRAHGIAARAPWRNLQETSPGSPEPAPTDSRPGAVK